MYNYLAKDKYETFSQMRTRQDAEAWTKKHDIITITGISILWIAFLIGIWVK